MISLVLTSGAALAVVPHARTAVRGINADEPDESLLPGVGHGAEGATDNKVRPHTACGNQPPLSRL